MSHNTLVQVCCLPHEDRPGCYYFLETLDKEWTYCEWEGPRGGKHRGFLQGLAAVMDCEGRRNVNFAQFSDKTATALACRFDADWRRHPEKALCAVDDSD